MFASFSDTNSCATTRIDLEKYLNIPLNFTIGDFLAFLTFILSVQYNAGNFYHGFTNAKDKSYALICTLPYFYI
jgi:hypothetical protein